MTNKFSRRVFLGGCLSGLGGAAWGAPLTVSLRPKLRPRTIVEQAITGADALVENAGLGGRVGFVVADVKTGLILESRNATIGQPPASVAKAVTALYALQSLGAKHRFQTRLIATSAVKNGILRGDLILEGGGDPTLDTNDLANLAAKLKAAGVREVRGRFLVSGGVLPFQRSIDPEQPDHLGYNPSVSGLSLNYNRVYFEWKRQSNGYGVSMDARSDKYRPSVQVARIKVVKRNLPVYTYKDRGGRDEWTVAQGALGKGGARWLPVRKPELYSGEVFRSFARSHGIVLKAPKVSKKSASGTVVARVSSPELRDIVRGMLKYSNNLTAEMIGLSATVKRGKRANTLRASAAEMSAWAKSALGMKNVRLVDHSGLGEASRISASDMSLALVKVHQNGVLKPILKAIPLRFSDGKVNKNHPIKVRAKTGTLNFVSALAGYMTAEDGTELAFAIFASDMKKRSAIKRADREKPQGERGWNKRAKKLQQALIERWGALYGR
ncbi:MAG: D-alanyl-D-alanine carboxypeptidase/D-alanyl-D-alanine-endopeptidase [Rhodobacterales bacterium]|nr:D-alanyl-D-alanine carboxypeptidase/D-alanyl-D-alanine-endopeptidase [Rhodobacterales bacterium]